MARTREVVRAIVEIRHADLRPEEVVVTLPEERTEGTQTRRPRTVEALLEGIAQNVKPSTLDRFRRFLDEVQERGVEVVGRDTSLSLRYTEPVTGRVFSPCFVAEDGTVNLFYIFWYIQQARMDRRIAMDYLETVAGLVPGAKVSIRETRTGSWVAVKVGSRSITLEDLMPCADKWLSAIDTLIARISAASRDDADRG